MPSAPNPYLAAHDLMMALLVLGPSRQRRAARLITKRLPAMSDERLAVLEERLALRQPLHQPGDVPPVEAEGCECQAHRIFGRR